MSKQKIKFIFIKVRRKTDNPYKENSKIQSGLWRMTYTISKNTGR